MSGKTIAIVLLALTCIVLAGFLLLSKLEHGNERRLRLHLEAREDLLLGASQRGCIPRSTIEQQADHWGWEHADLDVQAAEQDLVASALVVYVKPPYVAGKDPGVVYQFDDRACLIGPLR